MSPCAPKFKFKSWITSLSDSNLIQNDTEQPVIINVGSSDCITLYVDDDPDAIMSEQTETTIETCNREHRGVVMKDASTQTMNAYFFLQVYDEGGEMKLAFNTTSDFKDVCEKK